MKKLLFTLLMVGVVVGMGGCVQKKAVDTGNEKTTAMRGSYNIVATTTDMIADNSIDYCPKELSQAICHFLLVSDYSMTEYINPWVLATDVTSDGVKDYIVEAWDSGCGSCNKSKFLFFQNDTLYYTYDASEGDIVNADALRNGLVTIQEPVFKEGEPWCCPSSMKQTDIKCENNLYGIHCSIAAVRENLPLIERYETK